MAAVVSWVSVLQIDDTVTIPLCTANVFNGALESRIALHSLSSEVLRNSVSSDDKLS